MSPRGKKKIEFEVPNPVLVPTASIVETITAPESTKVAWEVFNKDGAYVRTYSVEVHGSEANRLAHQFATKIGGSVK